MNDSMISSNREQHSIAVTGASDNDTAPEPPTKKQKLIKAGLFLLLVIIVIYVILDYTVSGPRPSLMNQHQSSLLLYTAAPGIVWI